MLRSPLALQACSAHHPPGAIGAREHRGSGNPTRTGGSPSGLGTIPVGLGVSPPSASHPDDIAAKTARARSPGAIGLKEHRGSGDPTRTGVPSPLLPLSAHPARPGSITYSHQFHETPCAAPSTWGKWRSHQR